MHSADRADDTQSLHYERPQENDIEGVVWIVCILGIGIGGLRLVIGGLELRYSGVLNWHVWWMALTEDLFYIVAGALRLLLGANLVVASWACLYRKEWGRLLVLLGEPAAIVLILVSAVLSAFATFGGSAGASVHVAWDLSHMLRDLLANVTYPILAVAILRSRAARTFFVETAGEDPITPSQP